MEKLLLCVTIGNASLSYKNKFAKNNRKLPFICQTKLEEIYLSMVDKKSNVVVTIINNKKAINIDLKACVQKSNYLYFYAIGCRDIIELGKSYTVLEVVWNKAENQQEILYKCDENIDLNVEDEEEKEVESVKEETVESKDYSLGVRFFANGKAAICKDGGKSLFYSKETMEEWYGNKNIQFRLYFKYKDVIFDIVMKTYNFTGGSTSFKVDVESLLSRNIQFSNGSQYNHYSVAKIEMVKNNKTSILWSDDKVFKSTCDVVSIVPDTIKNKSKKVKILKKYKKLKIKVAQKAAEIEAIKESKPEIVESSDPNQKNQKIMLELSIIVSKAEYEKDIPVKLSEFDLIQKSDVPFISNSFIIDSPKVLRKFHSGLLSKLRAMDTFIKDILHKYIITLIVNGDNLTYFIIKSENKLKIEQINLIKNFLGDEIKIKEEAI